jgi:F1F0 ATPase subunit 2
VYRLLPLGLAFGAGIGLGLFFFYGLWLTVRKLPTVQRPALLSVCSFFGRLGVTLFGFYLVTGGHLEQLVVSLLGFLGARSILIRLYRPDKPLSGLLPKQVKTGAYQS